MPLTLPSETRKPAAVLFGAECHLTTAVLGEMLARELPVAAIVLSGPPQMDTPLRTPPARRQIRLLTPQTQFQTVTELAEKHQIDLYRIGNMRSAGSREMVRSLPAEYLLSVCFPRHIPAALTSELSGPALNLHPSLLPKLRGPDPMFWTFHAGDGRGGLTVHELSETFDAGKIAAQQKISIPDGITERELELRLSGIAVDMLINLLGTITRRQYSPSEQDHNRASYAPFPEDGDFVLHTSWTARRGYNFVSGIADRGEPILLITGGAMFRVVSVAGYDVGPAAAEAGFTPLRMADGYLYAQLEKWPTGRHDV